MRAHHRRARSLTHSLVMSWPTSSLPNNEPLHLYLESLRWNSFILASCGSGGPGHYPARNLRACPSFQTEKVCPCPENLVWVKTSDTSKRCAFMDFCQNGWLSLWAQMNCAVDSGWHHHSNVVHGHITHHYTTSLTHWLTDSLTHSLNHSLTHSLTHWFSCLFVWSHVLQKHPTPERFTLYLNVFHTKQRRITPFAKYIRSPLGDSITIYLRHQKNHVQAQWQSMTDLVSRPSKHNVPSCAASKLLPERWKQQVSLLRDNLQSWLSCTSAATCARFETGTKSDKADPNKVLVDILTLAFTQYGGKGVSRRRVRKGITRTQRSSRKGFPVDQPKWKLYEGNFKSNHLCLISSEWMLA